MHSEGLARVHAIAMLRHFGVRRISRLSKMEALALLRRMYAARTIQAWFRARTRVAAVCPLTGAPPRPTAVSVRVGPLRFVRYDADAIAAHLHAALHRGVAPVEPHTGAPLTWDMIRSIERQLPARPYGRAVATAPPRIAPLATGATAMVACIERVIDALLARPTAPHWSENMHRALRALGCNDAPRALYQRARCIERLAKDATHAHAAAALCTMRITAAAFPGAPAP
jgi:hypothetical protein